MIENGKHVVGPEEKERIVAHCATCSFRFDRKACMSMRGGMRQGSGQHENINIHF